MYIKHMIVLFLFVSSLFATGFPKQYYKIKNTDLQKRTFFEILYPMVIQSNKKILKEREFVENYFERGDAVIDTNTPEHKKLSNLARKYKIENIYNKAEYLNKIDIVPVSMTLAQAAIESGWGKSRFTKEANNIFGHWTYSEKGLVPKQRQAGKTHKIKIYESLQASVEGYMRNLNRTEAYKEFRHLREKYRNMGVNPKGLPLSQTMHKYSGIGHEYLRILRSMINKNQLAQYDTRFYLSHDTMLTSL